MTGVVSRTDNGCSPYYGIMPKLIKERGLKKGIEIGVLFGGHAKAILECPTMELLVGIDPYEMYEQGVDGIESQEDFDWVRRFAMNRVMSSKYIHILETSDNAYATVKAMDEVFDFVFIDGLHTHEQIEKDLNNYSQLIRKGGVIACHDYNHPNFPLLTKAIDDFARHHFTEVIKRELHTIYMDKTW
jgi:predicted O-methyltransferase YrrM